jgi:hypothetical protein
VGEKDEKKRLDRVENIEAFFCVEKRPGAPPARPFSP